MGVVPVVLSPQLTGLRTLTLDTEAGTEAEEGWAHVIPSLASAIIQSAHYPMSLGLW